MGTRINKVLGWGLKYHKINNDPRFDPEFFTENIQEMNITKEITKEVEHTEKKFASLYLKTIEKKSLYVYDFIHTCPFYTKGDIAPIVFSNPLNKDWNRYGDIIDSYEVGQYMDNNVTLITNETGQISEIYPYIGKYINRQTNKPIENLCPSDRWMYLKLNDYSGFQKYGFNSRIEFQRYIIPDIDPVLNAFFNVVKPFRNPKNKLYLKPMIYQYWS